jgi:hypothetical protein
MPIMSQMRSSSTHGQAQAADPTGAEPAHELTLGQQVRRWIVRGSATGLLLSLLIHALFLLIAAIWTIGVVQAGGAGARGGEVELAILSETELSALEEQALEVQTPSVTEVETALPSVDVLEAPTVTGGNAGDIGEVADSMSGAGGDIGGLDGLEGGSGGGAAKFFGVEATGTRFAYIVDTSGSMQGQKIQTLRIELLESINALLEHMAFQVVFFSTDSMPMGGKVKWTTASDVAKKWAADQAALQQAYGGTNPLPAFQLVLEMSPRPDAIYFMTDGLFDANQVPEIARLNKRGRRVQIHCIGFDIQDRAAEDLLMQIAEDSGGQYHSVPLYGRDK